MQPANNVNLIMLSILNQVIVANVLISLNTKDVSSVALMMMVRLGLVLNVRKDLSLLLI